MGILPFENTVVVVINLLRYTKIVCYFPVSFKSPYINSNNVHTMFRGKTHKLVSDKNKNPQKQNCPYLSAKTKKQGKC